MKIINLKTNRITNPLGFELGKPSLSWTVTETECRRQISARVEIALDGQSVYDSGERSDISQTGFRPELELRPRSRYMWRVTVTGESGESAVSDYAWFETGKLDEPWQAKWVAPDTDDVFCVLRGTAEITGDVTEARIYASGLGLYHLFVNGQRSSDERFAPGFNGYDSFVQYQTYDVGALLHSGENTVEMWLGKGIAKGRFARCGDDDYNYCPKYTGICEMHVRMSDGTERVFASGSGWTWRASNVTDGNIYDGETYDANVVSQYRPTEEYEPPVGELKARLSLPVRVKHELKPAALITTPAGETVLDMGQNMTGWVRFRVHAPKGRHLKLSYGEILQDGCFYRENLRTAKAEYHYISDGGEAVAEPLFTYYGFRYVKLEGFDKADIADFTGCVVYSNLERTGMIETSDADVNRLFENALWSQRGNFLDVPTDCPQRDERLGWTGDAQVFSGTACFNMDCRAFYMKYLYDMWCEQKKNDGCVPHVVPDAKGRHSPREGGAVAWSDAATVIPWNVYLHYGDRGVLEAQIDSMMAWTDWISAQDDWTETMHFGDWVALDNPRLPKARVGATDLSFLCMAYHFYSATLTAKALRALGRDSERYDNTARRVLENIRHEFFTPSGRLAVNTQTAYVVSLFMGLSPDPDKTRAELRERLRRDGGHLTTGFIGTPWLCRVLDAEAAYSLLLLDDYPSWLYQVKMGATTVWERWNSVMPDGHITPTQMNSLNHYSYGSIVEWMYRCMCGINPVEDAPGFVRARIAPQPDPTGHITYAKCTLDTAAGRYETRWEVSGGRLAVEVAVPFNCTSEIVLPDGSTRTAEAGRHKYEIKFTIEEKQEVKRNHGLL